MFPASDTSIRTLLNCMKSTEHTELLYCHVYVQILAIDSPAAIPCTNDHPDCVSINYLDSDGWLTFQPYPNLDVPNTYLNDLTGEINLQLELASQPFHEIDDEWILHWPRP